MPNLLEDVVQTQHSVEKKIEKIEYTKALYYDKKVYLIDTKKHTFYLYNDTTKESVDIDLKLSKKIFVKLNTDEVFDYKSIIAKQPIKIGVIRNNKLYKS